MNARSIYLFIFNFLNDKIILHLLYMSIFTSDSNIKHKKSNESNRMHSNSKETESSDISNIFDYITSIELSDSSIAEESNAKTKNIKIKRSCCKYDDNTLFPHEKKRSTILPDVMSTETIESMLDKIELSIDEIFNNTKR